MSGTFDDNGNAIVGNIAIPASHVSAFRALLAPDHEQVRQAIMRAWDRHPNSPRNVYNRAADYVVALYAEDTPCACCGLHSGWHPRHTSWCVEVGGAGLPTSHNIRPNGADRG